MAIGTPTIAFRSVPRSTLVMSPMRLIAINPTASQYPNLEVRHSPIAAATQNIETVDNKTTAQKPRLERFSCARVLRRHIDSRKLFGKSREMLAVRLIAAPARKKIISAVIPQGRSFVKLIRHHNVGCGPFYQVPP